METQTGWIKVHRKILESACFNDPNPLVFKVWSYCLLKATHTQTMVLRRSEQIILEPGQFLFSRVKWAKVLKVSPSTIRNIVALLVGWGMIEPVNSEHRKETLFLVKNWSEYQNNSSQSEVFEVEKIEKTKDTRMDTRMDTKKDTRTDDKKDTRMDTRNNQFNRVEIADISEPRTLERTLETTQERTQEITLERTLGWTQHTYITRSIKNLNTGGASANAAVSRRDQFLENLSPNTLYAWTAWESEFCEITTSLEENRAALNHLLELKGGIDSLEKLIKLACKAWEDKFAAREVRCSSPAELWKKRPALLAWGKGKFTQTEVLKAY